MRNTQDQCSETLGHTQLPFPGTLFIALDLLSVLPTVVDEADVSRATRLQLNEQLLQSSRSLYMCIEKVILCRNNCFHSHETIAILRLIRSWGMVSGITLSQLADTYQSLYLFLLSCLHSASTPQCLCEGSLCLQALVSVSEYPCPLLRNSAVAMVLQAWAGSGARSGTTGQPAGNQSPVDGVVVDVGSFQNPSLQYLLQNTGKSALLSWLCCGVILRFPIM